MISYKAGHINLTKCNHSHKQPSCTILRSDLHSQTDQLQSRRESRTICNQISTGRCNNSSLHILYFLWK